LDENAKITYIKLFILDKLDPAEYREELKQFMAGIDIDESHPDNQKLIFTALIHSGTELSYIAGPQLSKLDEYIVEHQESMLHKAAYSAFPAFDKSLIQTRALILTQLITGTASKDVTRNSMRYLKEMKNIPKEIIYTVLKQLGFDEYYELVSQLDVKLEEDRIREILLDRNEPEYLHDEYIIGNGEKIEISFDQEALESTQEILGGGTLLSVYQFFQTLNQNPFNAHFPGLRLKLKKSMSHEAAKNEAQKQFNLHIKIMKSQFLDPKFKISSIRNDALRMQLFRIFVNYDNSEFADQHSMDFEDHMDQLVAQEGISDQLKKGYNSSGPISISSLIAFSGPIELNSELETNLKKLFNNLLRSKTEIDAVGIEKGLESQINQLKQKVRITLQLLVDKLPNIDPRFQDPIKSKIERLNQFLEIDSENPDFAEMIMILYPIKDFKDDLQQLLFTLTWTNNEDVMRRFFQKINRTTGVKEYQQYVDLIEFVFNGMYEESFKKSVLGEESDRKTQESNLLLTNKFNGIMGVDYLQKELNIIKSNLGMTTKEVHFEPTRGPFLEFSGELADACWAGMYEHIGSEFPNVTAVSMIVDKGTSQQRAVGSCLLMEAKNTEGQKLLLIRGLNPKKDFISGLDNDDFLNQYIEYIKVLAKNIGAKACLVCDDHPGGCGTNRPTLFQSMQKKIAKLKRVELGPDPETKFNKYDLKSNNWTFYL
ncbi:MAG: hypothetical protein ACRCXZ_06045, partial [Patescibacteria group bacterium]